MGEPDDSPDIAISDSFVVRPVGYVQSTYAKTKDVTHTHDAWAADVSQIKLLPKYAKGLSGLEGYSHIAVLFWVHRAKEWKMPEGHGKPFHVEVFATRMPVRPNPIGLSVVELIEFSADSGIVVVKGLDALDGTPVLDIKPYLPNFDSCPEACVPQWVERHLNSNRNSTRTCGEGDNSKDSK